MKEQYDQEIAACEALGTDVEFQDFVRSQPSCVSGAVGTTVYAHVRRANNSGVGMKPAFSGVPLSYDEHLLQHQLGEAAVVNQRMGKRVNMTPAQAKEWFDMMASHYRKLWIESKK